MDWNPSAKAPSRLARPSRRSTSGIRPVASRFRRGKVPMGGGLFRARGHRGASRLAGIEGRREGPCVRELDGGARGDWHDSTKESRAPQPRVAPGAPSIQHWALRRSHMRITVLVGGRLFRRLLRSQAVSAAQEHMERAPPCSMSGIEGQLDADAKPVLPRIERSARALIKRTTLQSQFSRLRKHCVLRCGNSGNFGAGGSSRRDESKGGLEWSTGARHAPTASAKDRPSSNRRPLLAKWESTAALDASKIKLEWSRPLQAATPAEPDTRDTHQTSVRPGMSRAPARGR